MFASYNFCNLGFVQSDRKIQSSTTYLSCFKTKYLLIPLQFISTLLLQMIWKKSRLHTNLCNRGCFFICNETSIKTNIDRIKPRSDKPRFCKYLSIKISFLFHWGESYRGSTVYIYIYKTDRRLLLLLDRYLNCSKLYWSHLSGLDAHWTIGLFQLKVIKSKLKVKPTVQICPCVCSN